MNELKLILGRYDDPEHQKQDDYVVDLLQSNIAILGSSMSGKTTLLKTLLFQIHQSVNLMETQGQVNEEIYILDFSNDLMCFEKLPYVVAYFDSSSDENIRRIFHKVEERLEENIKLLRGVSFVNSDQDKKPSHITFIIDGINGLLSNDHYSGFDEILNRFFRDGLSKGLSIVFSGNDLTGGVSKYIGFCQSVIGLVLTKDMYFNIFTKKMDQPINAKGRGIASSNGGTFEFQSYLPCNPTKYLISKDKDETEKVISLDDLDMIDQFLQQFSDYYKSINANDYIIFMELARRKKMTAFMEELTVSNWEKYTKLKWPYFLETLENLDQNDFPVKRIKTFRMTDFVAGINYYLLKPLVIDLESAHTIAIYGKKKFGKTNLLKLILSAAINIQNVKVVIFEDARRDIADSIEIKDLLEGIPTEYYNSKAEYQKAFEQYFHSEDVSKSVSEEIDALNQNTASIVHGLDELYKEVLGSKNIEESEMRQEQAAVSEIIESDTRHEDDTDFFHIFIVQSRLFYQVSPWTYTNKSILTQLCDYIGNDNTTKNNLFIFSDVQKITESEANSYFNNCIRHAFLLDDIVRFINDKGAKSIFANQDASELKERFGKCDLGDGYYFDIERDSLDKVRLLKYTEKRKERWDEE